MKNNKSVGANLNLEKDKKLIRFITAMNEKGISDAALVKIALSNVMENGVLIGGSNWIDNEKDDFELEDLNTNLNTNLDNFKWDDDEGAK